MITAIFAFRAKWVFSDNVRIISEDSNGNLTTFKRSDKNISLMVLSY